MMLGYESNLNFADETRGFSDLWPQAEAPRACMCRQNRQKGGIIWGRMLLPVAGVANKTVVRFTLERLPA